MPTPRVDSSSRNDDALLGLPGLNFAGTLGVFTLILLVGALVGLRTKIPVVATGEFRVVATMGSDPLQAPAAGTIARLSVLEGAMVQQGQVVVELRSDKIEALQMEKQHLQRDVAELAATIELLAEQRKVAHAGAGELDRAMQRRIGAARRKTTDTEALADAGEKLAAVGAGSANAWLAARVQSASSLGELNDLRYSALDVQQSMRLRVLDYDRQAADLRMRLEERASNLKQVDAALGALAAANVHVIVDAEHAGQRRIQITAPYAGTVVELGQHRDGALVEQGALLLRIARAESPLEAEIVLHDKQAARLSASAEVRLMYDAFPFTQYGARSSRVRWVSPVAEGGTVRARALVTPHRFDVGSAVRGVYPGMVGTVRAVVDERSVLDMLLDPLRRTSANWGFRT